MCYVRLFSNVKCYMTHLIRSSNLPFLALTFFVVFLSIVDASTVRISGMFHSEINSDYYKIIFSLIAIVNGLYIYIILFKENKSNVASASNEIHRSHFFSLSRSFHVLLIIFLLVIVGFVLLLDTYKVFMVYLTIIVTHVCSLAYFSWLIIRTITWYMNIRNRLMLLYISTYFIFELFILFSLVNYGINLGFLFRGVTYTPYYDLIHTVGLELINWKIIDAIFPLLLFSSITMWISIAILLKQYLRRISKLRYWSLISIPIIFYSIQFLFIEMDFLSSIILINPFNNLLLYELLFVYSTPLVGIIFGITMMLISRKFTNPEIRRNLIMLSIGFMLLFCSFQPNSLLYKPFPPFGLTLTLMSLGSFIVITSLYRTIVIITKNTKIFRELVTVLGDENFIIYFTEGKRIYELSRIINNINRSIHTENRSGVSIDNLSSYEINDILEFIRGEFHQK